MSPVTQTSGEPLWKPEHVKRILSEYGVVAIQRQESNALVTMEKLQMIQEIDVSLFLVDDRTFPNRLSSTLLRQALKEGYSIRYCAPDSVVDYITENRLYISTDN